MLHAWIVFFPVHAGLRLLSALRADASIWAASRIDVQALFSAMFGVAIRTAKIAVLIQAQAAMCSVHDRLLDRCRCGERMRSTAVVTNDLEPKVVKPSFVGLLFVH